MNPPFDKEYSNKLVNWTINVSELYNKRKLRTCQMFELKLYQTEMQDSLTLHEYLWDVSDKPYFLHQALLDIRMLLLRLSCLIHEGRIETHEERGESITRFTDKYGYIHEPQIQKMLDRLERLENAKA